MARDEKHLMSKEAQERLSLLRLREQEDTILICMTPGDPNKYRIKVGERSSIFFKIFGQNQRWDVETALREERNV